MKRCAVGLALLALVSTFLFAQTQTGPQSPGADVHYWAPYVTQASTRSVTINWRGETDGTGAVDYATSSYYSKHQRLNKTKAAQAAGTNQHVKISGLKPDTSYTYKVRPTGHEDAFGYRTFRTLPASGPFTFVVVSDSQEGHDYPEAKRFKAVADAVAKEPDVRFILHGGDCARFDDEARWTLFFEAADGMLARFPLFTTMGNHEYHDINSGNNPPTGAVQYHEAYGVPPYYSFDCAGVRFIVLDSPDPAHANGDDPHTSLALAQSQSSFLEKELRRKKLGAFTIHHHPIWDYYSTAPNPDLQPWETLYQTYRISASFAGHTHNYQRYDIEGIPYFIVGDGGGPCGDLVSNDPPPAGYQFGVARILGYLRVTVDPKHNMAVAQEVFVGWVKEDDSAEAPHLYDPPIIGDGIAFRLVE